MPQDLIRDFRPGDELTGDLVAAVIAELRRWRQADVVPPLAADGLKGDSPPIFYLADEPLNRKATLSGTLATGTLASPTSCTAELYYWTGSSWTDSGIAITVYNSYPLTSSLPSGRQVDVRREADGTWHLLTAACS